MRAVIVHPSVLEAMEEVVQEVTELKLSERATRLIDGEKEDSMEKKKTEGYF
jgi:sulfate adenylyltransferase subunit 2